MTVNYRESYGIFGASGILFNHESPLRGREFVTRKITDGVARIARGKLDALELGNLDAQRDWGFAARIRRRHVAHAAARTSPTRSCWRRGRCSRCGASSSSRSRLPASPSNGAAKASTRPASMRRSGTVRVRINPAFYRPAEVEQLLGNAAKAHAKLGWRATTPLERSVPA